MNKITIWFFILTFVLIASKSAAQDVSGNQKHAVLSKVIEKLEAIYPFPEASEKVVNGLMVQISGGFYDRYNSSAEFATQVTLTLERYSKDKHLDLLYDPRLAKALLEEKADGTDYTKEEAKAEIWNNYGFKELKILDGNIGYLLLNVFFSTAYAGTIADVSMKFLGQCNALIIDLRQNGGGWGDMVVHLLSNFVDHKKPLLLDVTRSTLDGSIDSTIVPVNFHDGKLTGIPIYLLISPVTASAAEAFTFYLKHLSSDATLVGKRTKGAENPVEHIALDSNFVLQIPVWKKMYSLFPGGWEGAGIDADVEIDPVDALKAAQKMALEKLLATTGDKAAIEKFQWALDGLSASYQNIHLNTIKELAGSYGKIKIMFKKNRLYFQSGDGSAKLLIPISEKYFVVEGADYFRIKFIATKSGMALRQIFTFGTEREYIKK